MVPTLHIDKIEAGLYAARVCDGNAEISEHTVHGTIAEALVALSGTLSIRQRHLREK